MSKLEKQTLQLPAGFRFHPSDEELITHYLRNKLTSSPLPATIIAELDLYKYNPWELPSKALFGEEEWYFFTPRDRKYPNGTRPNRAAGVGYWKATGTDKHILGEGGMKSIGVKKALVFYSGHPPKGVKSEWIMSEYRLLDNMMWSNHASKPKGSMRLDDWVLCRVRLKCNNMRNVWEDQNTSPSYKPSGHFGKVIREPCLEEVSPSIEMVRSFLHKDLPMLPSILASQHVLPATIKTTSSIVFLNSTTTGTKNSNEADSNKINNCRQISDSSLDCLINPLKRKIEGNEHHHWCSAAPSKRICSRDFRTEEGSYDSLISSTSWGLGNQVQGDNLNGDEWSSLIQYQELGQLIGFPCN